MGPIILLTRRLIVIIIVIMNDDLSCIQRQLVDHANVNANPIRSNPIQFGILCVCVFVFDLQFAAKTNAIRWYAKN